MRNLCESDLQNWYKNSSEDDINYACELLIRWETELEIEALELLDDVDDLNIANMILYRIGKL